jgi:hypothetical protein
MKDIIKAKQINELTKKHPQWKKVFLGWLDINIELDISQLEHGFKTLIKYKNILSSEINIDFARNLDSNQSMTTSEVFNDAVQGLLHTKQKHNFIKSLKTSTYHKMFTHENEKEINLILDNGISIEALKHQFFNKLARYKSPEKLLNGLVEFRKQNIHWNEDTYLKKAKELNTRIVGVENNTLMIEVLDFEACKALGPQSWCITQQENTFKNYIREFNRQVIFYDFNLPLDNNESIIGYTVNFDGRIGSSHLKNDDRTPEEMLKKVLKFKPLSKKFLLDKIRSYEGDGKKIELLMSIGNTDFFDKENEFNSSFEKIINNVQDSQSPHVLTRIFDIVVKKNNISIFKRLFKQLDLTEKMDDPDNYFGDDFISRLLRTSITENNIEIFNIMLDNPNVDPSDDNDVALKMIYHLKRRKIASGPKSPAMLSKFNDILLKHEKTNSNFLIDYNFTHLVGRSPITLITDIEIRNQLSNKELNPFAYNNEAIKASISENRMPVLKILLKSKRITDHLNIKSLIKHSLHNQTPETFKLILNSQNNNFDKGVVPANYYNSFLKKFATHGFNPKFKEDLFELMISQKTFIEQPEKSLEKVIDNLYEKLSNSVFIFKLIEHDLYPSKSCSSYRICDVMDLLSDKNFDFKENIQEKYWNRVLKISSEINKSYGYRILGNLSQKDNFKAIKVVCQNKDILSSFENNEKDKYAYAKDRIKDEHVKYIKLMLKKSKSKKNIFGF